MKKFVLKISIFIVPIFLCVSMMLVLNKYSGKTYTQQIFEAENDYRLKFVDSTDVELNLGPTDKVILPLEVLSVKEEGGFIIVNTYENAVVLAPVDCYVNSYSATNAELELKSGNITVVISGIVSGVKSGNKLSCGAVLGTVRGESCALQVFWGSRKLTLKELKAIL